MPACALILHIACTCFRTHICKLGRCMVVTLIPNEARVALERRLSCALASDRQICIHTDTSKASTCTRMNTMSLCLFCLLVSCLPSSIGLEGFPGLLLPCLFSVQTSGWRRCTHMYCSTCLRGSGVSPLWSADVTRNSAERGQRPQPDIGRHHQARRGGEGIPGLVARCLCYGAATPPRAQTKQARRFARHPF